MCFTQILHADSSSQPNLRHLTSALLLSSPKHKLLHPRTFVCINDDIKVQVSVGQYAVGDLYQNTKVQPPIKGTVIDVTENERGGGCGYAPNAELNISLTVCGSVRCAYAVWFGCGAAAGVKGRGSAVECGGSLARGCDPDADSCGECGCGCLRRGVVWWCVLRR